ncbi:MAG TPA: alpha/beta hydrolase [Bryobacteraceae bacterium]|nr:alpha/beta hydrolase [Bryobacteraceae bacterium]
MRTPLTLVLLLLLAAVCCAQSPKTPPGSFIDVDGSRIYCEECGTGSDAVILLHDGVANSAVWDDVWPAFCKAFHAIRYDRRGYGRSPATTKPYYEANDLAALVHDRKISHVAVVASSHGGEVAMSFALRYTAYVSDLVLVGPAASGFPYSEHFIMRERTTWQSNKVPELIDATLRDPYLIVPGHDAARKSLREILTASPQDLTHDDMPLPEPPTFPNVQRLHMPTLILVGSADIADNHAVAGALVMAIPGSIRLVVPDTGHLMYVEKPREFFTTVNMFLTAHGFPAGGR